MNKIILTKTLEFGDKKSSKSVTLEIGTGDVSDEQMESLYELLKYKDWIKEEPQSGDANISQTTPTEQTPSITK